MYGVHAINENGCAASETEARLQARASVQQPHVRRTAAKSTEHAANRVNLVAEQSDKAQKRDGGMAKGSRGQYGAKPLTEGLLQCDAKTRPL